MRHPRQQCGGEGGGYTGSESSREGGEVAGVAEKQKPEGRWREGGEAQKRKERGAAVNGAVGLDYAKR